MNHEQNHSNSVNIRLQKFIADCGVTSRRKAEDLITQGRVKINGDIHTQLGVKVNPQKDVVEVDGQVLDLNFVEKVYVVLNKPRGYVTTVSDPEGRPCVMDLCKNFNERIYPVGRLDYLSEGLIILTNDGELTQTLAHPRHGVEKVYEIKVFGHVDQKLLNKLRKGAQLEVGFIKPVAVRILKQLPHKTWLEFRLQDGKNREIRRLCEHFGLAVDKLKRVAIGGLSIQNLAPGKYQTWPKKKLLREIGLNEAGELNVNAKKFISNKKSVPLKTRLNTQSEFPADDKKYQKYHKGHYYRTLEHYKKVEQERLAAKNSPVTVSETPTEETPTS